MATRLHCGNSRSPADCSSGRFAEEIIFLGETGKTGDHVLVDCLTKKVDKGEVPRIWRVQTRSEGLGSCYITNSRPISYCTYLSSIQRKVQLSLAVEVVNVRYGRS